MKQQIYSFLVMLTFVGFGMLVTSRNAFSQEVYRGKIKQGKTESRYNNKLSRGNDPGTADHVFSLEHDGLTRQYKVHLPPDYDRVRLAPVVIYLHGGGGSLKAAYIDGLDKASDRFGFILVVPAGSGVMPNRFLSWHSGAWPGARDGCCAYAARNNIDDVGFISKMIREVKKNFRVDANRIYSTGISNGAMMSYRLACELSDQIAAIAPVASPAVPMQCSPLRPVPVMHIHGTADPCTPYNGGIGGGCIGSKKYFMPSAKETVGTWKKINKCLDGSTLAFSSNVVYQKGDATCISYKECVGRSEVEFCTIQGGGHTWPSGSQYLPVDRIGPVSYDISFEQIWDFFRKHSLEKVRMPE